MNADQVLRRHQDQLMALPNVNGTDIATDDVTGGQVIRVFVSQKVPRDQLRAGEVIPAEVDGVSVKVVEIGDIAIQ
jgi:hypothetical protein